MTNKDLKLMYKQETGKYPYYLEFPEIPENPEFSDLATYITWLEEKVIQSENENYKLKKELMLKLNDYELRRRR